MQNQKRLQCVYIQTLLSTDIKHQIDLILAAVDSNRGDGITRQLGLVGPLSLDHTDTELVTTIRQSFKIAEETNVAVVFHIDDAMFWINRQDLWSDSANVEWSNWNGPVVPHRYIGWFPTTLAPQMCYNSPLIKQAVLHVAKDLIGVELKKWY